jgi:26S proteasome regulatory subunit T2
LHDIEKRRQEAAPARIGRKKKKRGVEASSKLPQVNPVSKCRLRLLRQERVKDYLLMEEEFIKNAFKIDNNSSSMRKSMQFLRSRF